MASIKKILKKTWHFIWEEDSLLSWIVNIVLAFVIIKFVFYPVLGLVLGTSYPIVAVVSESMEHDGSFEKWWNSECCTNNNGNCFTQADIYGKQGITKEKFREFDFSSGFNKGDLMVLRSAKETKIGDILVFKTTGRKDPIIHRIIKIKETEKGRVYTTKGDRNCGFADFEKEVPEQNVVGKALFRIPLLGWLKLGFVQIFSAFGA